jgi:hypothetical protein
MTPEELHEFILKTQIVEFGKPLKKVKKAEMCAHFKCVESTLCKYLKILTIKGVIQLYDNGGRITLERLEDIAHPEVEAMAIHTTKHCIAVTDAMMLIAYTVEEVATEAVGSTMEKMDTAGQQQYIAMLERLKEVAVRHAVRNQLHKRNVKKLMEAIEDDIPEEETEGSVYAI